MSPFREVERILQHSRAVIQEASSRLKVRSCSLSVPHEMADDSSQRHTEGTIQEAAHCVFDMLIGKHPHKGTLICVK